MFHEHLLEKSIWPELALDERNLILCCSDCHSKKTNGYPEPEHKRLIEKARKQLLSNE